ncbi:MAG: hypothetical protein AAF799_37440 [Myxococcota bacterium]
MSIVSQITAPLRLASTLVRRLFIGIAPLKPSVEIASQAALARQVDATVLHQIRAGRTHRFIDILFVTVDDRVFCRRYTYGERSWRDVFLRDPDGQVALNRRIVDIEARVPEDLDTINPRVNAAYEAALQRIGANWMLAGAVEQRAMDSTMEITVSPPGRTASPGRSSDRR